MNSINNLKIKKIGHFKKFHNQGKPKLILIDIDGTLVDKSEIISIDTKKLISEVQKKIPISLISARSRNSAYRFVQQLSLENYNIFENGAVIMNKEFKPVYAKYINRNRVKSLYQFIIKNKLDFNVCVDGLTNYYKQISTLDHLPRYKVTRISLLNLKKNSLTRTENSLKKIPDINYFRVVNKNDFSNWNIDITSSKANKEKALKYLCKLNKVYKSQTIGIGDGYNDLPFIKNVHLKIAMGNAVDELKSIADIIAPPIQKNGLVYILKMIKNKFI